MPDRRIVHFDVRQLDVIWLEVMPLLGPALDCGEGELDIAQLRLLLVSRKAELLLAMSDNAVAGAAVVEFVQYPNYMVGSFIAIGGKGLFASDADADQVKHWLKNMGASRMQGYCPDSVARLWARRGGRKAYNVMRWDL